MAANLKLLEKYMALVLLEEGTTFVAGDLKWAGFSTDENEILQRLKAKVEKAYDTRRT